MTDLDEESATAFVVLVDDETHYAIWPNIKGVPKGWCNTYGPASQYECMVYVQRTRGYYARENGMSLQ